MLGGKDFRGSQQRALITGIDHLQHRQHRHDGLTGADLALQKPVHRPGRGQFPGDHVEHLTLAGRQLERQRRGHRGQQTAGAPRRGRTRVGQFTMAALGQRPLQADGLVEGQPLARPIPLILALGDVDGPQRGILADQMALAHSAFRQRLRDRIQHVEHLADAGVDIPALQFRPGRVDREKVPLERRHVEFAALIRGGRGDGLQRLGSAEAARRRVQNQVPGVGELHGAPEVAHLAGQHQPGALHQLLLEVLGVEEGRGHLRAALAQGDDEVFPAGASVGPADLRALHLPDEGDVLTRFGWVVILAENLAAVTVLSRIVAQQIVDGADAEGLIEAAGGLAADDRVEPVGQRHHGYSTPISRTSPRWPVA